MGNIISVYGDFIGGVSLNVSVDKSWEKVLTRGFTIGIGPQIGGGYSEGVTGVGWVSPFNPNTRLNSKLKGRTFKPD